MLVLCLTQRRLLKPECDVTARQLGLAETGKYPATLAMTGWGPAPGSAYAYFYAHDVVPSSQGDPEFMTRARDALARARIEVLTGPDGFLAAAVAALGGATLDIWAIDAGNNLTHVTGES